MSKVVKKIRSILNTRKTYQVGLLQDKAYRVLKLETKAVLKPFGITPTQWAFLGILCDNKAEIRLNGLAQELGVKAPLVTVIFTHLKKMNLIDSHKDEDDSRAKKVFLTKKGYEFVTQVEKTLRKEIRPLLNGLSLKEVVAYVSVLEAIVKNSENYKNNK